MMFHELAREQRLNINCFIILLPIVLSLWTMPVSFYVKISQFIIAFSHSVIYDYILMKFTV